MYHHYADGSTAFGISSSLFDVIFGMQQQATREKLL
jgi:sterol desaturase/sphingolipid hydroxylase (fatty acid hydroxylase superfamily)